MEYPTGQEKSEIRESIHKTMPFNLKVNSNVPSLKFNCFIIRLVTIFEGGEYTQEMIIIMGSGGLKKTFFGSRIEPGRL